MTINNWGDIINPLANSMLDFMGMRVYQSDLCVAWVPNKKHKKRRNQSVSYHKRIQKKWTKRYGKHEEKVAYIMDGSVFGSNSKALLMHPEQFVQLRNFT